jgi:hypothetical protein
MTEAGWSTLQFHVNGVARQVAVDPEMPILWVLRDVLGLTGTKYGWSGALRRLQRPPGRPRDPLVLHAHP